eukprot:8273497-Karenia_brevis.AAC.1
MASTEGGKRQAHVARKRVGEFPEPEQAESDQSKHEALIREGKNAMYETNSDVDDMFGVDGEDFHVHQQLKHLIWQSKH